ncbi:MULTISPECIES: putative polysaccharide biosynthesis protein [unclassified Clostridium]|uniref:putative polysaccharide biosynthesis protein n=1 Tax=unclassified Clostridium TaxID=2614128 RepID=UPI0025B9F5EA|nr:MULTISPECIES: polysaccharide biosynthesis protein [unclassified Clostridium]
MKAQSAGKGFLVLSISSLIVKLVSLLYLPILNIIITTEGYGVYNIAYIFFAFIYTINLGVSVAISKSVSHYTSIDNKKSSRQCFENAKIVIYIFGIGIGLIMFFFSKPLANLLNYPDAYLTIKMLSPTVLISGILAAYRGYFQGKRNMIPTAISEIVEQLINVPVSLYFASKWIEGGIAKGCAGATIGSFTGALIALIYLRILFIKSEKEKYSYSFLPHIVKEILKYAIPVTLILGLQQFISLVDLAQIKGRLLYIGFDHSQADKLSGILGNFNTLINVPMTIISALSTALLPSITSSLALKDNINLQNKISYGFKLCVLISIPAFVGLTVLSSPIYKMLYPTVPEGHILMRFGAIIILLWSIMQIQVTILQSMSKTYRLFLHIFIGSVFRIVVNYFLVGVPSINIKGAIVGMGISFLIPAILNQYYINKKLNIKLRIYNFSLKVVISALIMGISCYIFQSNLLSIFNKIASSDYIANGLSVLISVIFGIGIYGFLVYILGAVKKEEIKFFIKR